MSQLRQRAAQVKEVGAMERRNWNPAPGSAHHKIYRWWQRKSGKHVPVENFCHFWRVVLIWAPLRWLAKPLLVLLSLAIVGGIVTLAIFWLSTILGVLATITGLTYLVFGVRATGQLLNELNEREFNEFRWRWLDKQNSTVKAAVCLAVLPVELPLAVILIVIGSLAVLLVSLNEDYDVYRRVGHWLVGAHFSERKALGWIRPWLAFPVALAITSIWFQAARVVLAFVGAFCVGTGLMLLGSYLIDRARERRKQAELEAEERARRLKREVTLMVLRRIFAIVHLKWIGSEARFQIWRQRYEKHCMDFWGRFPEDLPISTLLAHVSDRYHKLYGRSDPVQVSSGTPVEERKPSKVKRFVVNVGDFFVLIWSVVLTKKWKICPIVTIPE